MNDLRTAAQAVIDEYSKHGPMMTGYDSGQVALAKLRQALAEPDPSVDALIDILAETPFRKTLGDSKWQATFNDQQLDIINNAIRARGQK